MKKIIILLLFTFNILIGSPQSNAQTCSATIDFGSTTFNYTGDIVNNTSGNTSNTLSYDLWNDNGTTTTSCSTSGGNNDLTIEFTSNTGTNPYSGGSVQNSLTNTVIDITQTAQGLVSALQYSATSASYTGYPGETRSQTIKVTFPSHVSIKASDFNVQYSSGNSSTKAFESLSIVFLNAGGNPYGTATYNGYYGSGSNPSVTTCGTTGISPGTPYSTSGTGIWLASSTGTVITSANNCIVSAGSNGANDNKTINAQTDAGLNGNDVITGFIWVHRLENVQGAVSTTTTSSPTSTSTSTLKGFSISALPVPVELISFSAMQIENSVQLTWATASELNNDYFDIEKLVNGSEFETIGRVSGAGNSNEIIDYLFTDKYINKSSFYRLKQVDFDNEFEYSEVIYVSVNQSVVDIVTNETGITIHTPLAESTEYLLLTSSGLVIEKGRFEKNEHTINANLVSGIYFLTIYADGELHQQRIVR
jgi:hypothetical protein